MNFLQKIRSSMYDPAFYRKIPTESFGSTFRYFLLLCLILTALRVAFLILPVTTGINTAAQYLTRQVLEQFPANLHLTFQDGHASTNAPQPYSIPLCDQGQCVRFVIDTRNVPTNEYLKQPDVVLILTRDTVFVKETNGDIRGYSLAHMHNFTLDKQTISDAIQQFSPWVKFVIPAIIILLGIGIYIASLFNLIYIFLLALFLWLLAKKFAPGMTYGQSYKVGIHAMTLGMIVNLLLDVTNWFLHLYAFPFMGTLLAIVVFIINYNGNSSKVGKKVSVPRKTIKKKK